MASSKKSNSSFIEKVIEVANECHEHYSLKDLNNLRVGGVSDYFAVANDSETLTKLIKLANEEKVSFKVIGGGTNLLISDAGFPGLTILNKTSGWHVMPNNQILIQSGTRTNQLSNALVSLGLGNLEFLAGVPGTIGGAVLTNASIDNHNIEPFIRESTWYHCQGEECKILTYNQKETILLLKHIKDQYFQDIWTLLAVKCQVSQLTVEEAIRRTKIFYLHSKNVHPTEPSIGYFFDQPISDEIINDKNFKKYFKGKISLSKKSPQYLITQPLIPASMIKDFLDDLKNSVKEAYGLDLNYRIDLMGLWPENEK